eukprot:841509_1
MLVLPLHLGGIHWCCGVINFQDKKLSYFDSIKGFGGASDFFKVMRKYLMDEHTNKQIEQMYGIQLDLGEWVEEDHNYMYHYKCSDGSYEPYDQTISDMLSSREWKQYEMKTLQQGNNQYG